MSVLIWSAALDWFNLSIATVALLLGIVSAVVLLRGKSRRPALRLDFTIERIRGVVELSRSPNEEQRRFQAFITGTSVGRVPTTVVRVALEARRRRFFAREIRFLEITQVAEHERRALEPTETF
ncbi:MAG: hypothetical protein ACYTF8_13860, partial [Planctomycetota bacterium]